MSTPRFALRRRVAFSETDSAGVMHFSNFFRWFEDAEHAFLRSLGHSVYQVADGRRLSFPRVHAEADYLRPLRFEDEVDVCIDEVVVGRRSVRYALRVVGDDGADIARGALVVVAAWVEDGRLTATDLPAELAEVLRARS